MEISKIVTCLHVLDCEHPLLLVLFAWGCVVCSALLLAARVFFRKWNTSIPRQIIAGLVTLLLVVGTPVAAFHFWDSFPDSVGLTWAMRAGWIVFAILGHVLMAPIRFKQPQANVIPERPIQDSMNVSLLSMSDEAPRPPSSAVPYTATHSAPLIGLLHTNVIPYVTIVCIDLHLAALITCKYLAHRHWPLIFGAIPLLLLPLVAFLPSRTHLAHVLNWLPFALAALAAAFGLTFVSLILVMNVASALLLFLFGALWLLCSLLALLALLYNRLFTQNGFVALPQEDEL